MHGTFVVCVCAVMLTCSNAFIHPFLWEDFPRMPSPNASRRFQLPTFKASSDIEGIPWIGVRSSPVQSRIQKNEINTRRLENMLTEFFSVLLYADDCTLLERQTQGMGPVYLDTGFNTSRSPLLLRSGVRDIMRKYNIPLRPVERKWNVTPSNESEIDV
jgi:hypothetical protein